MAERQKGSSGRVRLVVAGVVVVAALSAGIYVTLTGQRNGTASVACGRVKALAVSLDPWPKGELAAFQVAREPESCRSSPLRGRTAGDELAAFKGKVTLVNLWATWCAPCRKEMPALDRLAGALGGDDFAVVPVSIDIGESTRPAAYLQQSASRTCRSIPTRRPRFSRG